MKNKIIWLLIALFAFTCCKKDDDDDGSNNVLYTEDLIVNDNEISGWTKTGVSWHANSSSDLNTYINGEEPIYTNHGFVEASKQEYEGQILGETANIELRIFDQGNADNSKSLFDELAIQLSNPTDWGGAGTEAKIERIGTVYAKIILYKQKYYVYISINNGVDEAVDVIKTFANNIDGKISE